MSTFFENRKKAGEQLAELLAQKKLTNVIVLALPKGGVPVAAEVARKLHAPLDILLVRKLGAPFNPELALGAVVEGVPTHTVLNDEMIGILKVEKSHIESEKQKQIAELQRQQQIYRKGMNRSSVEGKTTILIDDGVATGASVRAALRALGTEKPAKLILAVPVAPPDVIQALKSEVTEVITVAAPREFQAVGQFYRDFQQVTESEVIELLAKLRP